MIARMRPLLLLWLALLILLPIPPAYAWGDEGHAVVARIAEHYLRPAVLRRVQGLLATDRSGLVPDTGLESEAVWADRYRESDRHGSRERYELTRQWHYVDIERDAPDMAAACFGSPPLPPGVAASTGPADACVIDKITQFERELRAPGTTAAEQLRALQFLLHLIGDLHQPLHAIDNHDEGGNLRRVSAGDLLAATLHQYWDVEFVRLLDPDPDALAARLIARIAPADVRRWGRGDPADWARESFLIGNAVGYDGLPAPERHRVDPLSASYVEDAKQAVALQLSRAGVRLAAVLNRSLS
jgi:hypothetical protein